MLSDWKIGRVCGAAGLTGKRQLDNVSGENKSRQTEQYRTDGHEVPCEFSPLRVSKHSEHEAQNRRHPLDKRREGLVSSRLLSALKLEKWSILLTLWPRSAVHWEKIRGAKGSHLCPVTNMKRIGKALLSKDGGRVQARVERVLA